MSYPSLSTGFRAPARNVGMTNQIAAMHKLHSTKSTIGFQEAWRMASFSESEVASALSRAATKLGYSTLLPQQERVVRAFVRGRDVFVSLPTGSGKSLCYCLLPLLFDELYGSQRKSIVVVVSPLISLMKDQVRSMKERDVAAVYVGDCAEEEGEVTDICSGKYQLVHMSSETPERKFSLMACHPPKSSQILSCMHSVYELLQRREKIFTGTDI